MAHSNNSSNNKKINKLSSSTDDIKYFQMNYRKLLLEEKDINSYSASNPIKNINIVGSSYNMNRIKITKNFKNKKDLLIKLETKNRNLKNSLKISIALISRNIYKNIYIAIKKDLLAFSSDTNGFFSSVNTYNEKETNISNDYNKIVKSIFNELYNINGYEVFLEYRDVLEEHILLFRIIRESK